MRGLLHELGILQLAGTPLNIDSQSAIYVATNESSVRRSVWIQRRVEVMQEASELGEIQPRKVDRALNRADIFTGYRTYRVWYTLLCATLGLPSPDWASKSNP